MHVRVIDRPEKLVPRYGPVQRAVKSAREAGRVARTIPANDSVRVHVHVVVDGEYDHEVVGVKASELPGFVAQLAQDPTVTRFTVGSTTGRI